MEQIAETKKIRKADFAKNVDETARDMIKTHGLNMPRSHQAIYHLLTAVAYAARGQFVFADEAIATAQEIASKIEVL